MKTKTAEKSVGEYLIKAERSDGTVARIYRGGLLRATITVGVDGEIRSSYPEDCEVSLEDLAFGYKVGIQVRAAMESGIGVEEEEGV